MNLKSISQSGIDWIDSDELPVNPGLRVIRWFDPYEGMDEEEIEAYFDFMHWALMREHAILLSIPKPDIHCGFWPFEFDELGYDVSAFNTNDFERLHPNRFNTYHYRLKKIFERVRDLAIMHSVVSSETGRLNILKRYQNLVECEFHGRLMWLIQKYERDNDANRRYELEYKIAELRRHIRECKKIWEHHAPRDI